MSSSCASSASFFRASVKVFLQYASSLAGTDLSSAGAALVLSFAAGALFLSSAAGVLVLSCADAVCSTRGACISPATEIVPLMVSRSSFVIPVAGLAEGFFDACALRAASATLSWGWRAISKVGENNKALTSAASRIRFAFMIIGRLSRGDDRVIKFWRASSRQRTTRPPKQRGEREASAMATERKACTQFSLSLDAHGGRINRSYRIAYKR